MLGDPRYNRDSVASTTIASAPVTLDPVASVAVASAHDALASVASAPVTLATVASANDEDTSTDDALASMQCEDVDLVEAEDEKDDDNKEVAGFDVVENVTFDMYHQQQQECDANKLQIIESNWCVKTKSGNAELVWTVAPDSIPENPSQEFSSLGVRNVNWDRFTSLSSIIFHEKMLKSLNLFWNFSLRSGLEIGSSNRHS
jgi:hypothetical protein